MCSDLNMSDKCNLLTVLRFQISPKHKSKSFKHTHKIQIN